MGELDMSVTAEESIRMFDEQGTLIGTIHRPLVHDAVGPGRETVYLVRAEESQQPAAAA